MQNRERLMSNTARLVTADELERMPEDDYRYELVRGRLIRMSPVAPRHGHTTITLGALLWQHVRANRLGQVWTEVGFRLASNPDTVRAPDIAFVRHDRLPPKDAKGFYRGAPDLAIEVLSPDDTRAEMRQKIADYFAAGTPAVVVIDPGSRRAAIHRPGTAVRILTTADTLDLDAIVAGFRLPLCEVFD
ncbi:MAG TPA: Uma2 family endonuclease [Vicinamibacterales bacterium]